MLVSDIIRNSRLQKVVVTDTIFLPPDMRDSKIEVISVCWLIAEAIRRIHEGRSVSALFQAEGPRQGSLIKL